MFYFLFFQKHTDAVVVRECEQFLWLLQFLQSTEFAPVDQVGVSFSLSTAISFTPISPALRLGANIGFVNDTIVRHIPKSS